MQMEKIGEDCLMSAEIGSFSNPNFREVSGTTRHEAISLYNNGQ